MRDVKKCFLLRSVLYFIWRKHFSSHLLSSLGEVVQIIASFSWQEWSSAAVHRCFSAYLDYNKLFALLLPSYSKQCGHSLLTSDINKEVSPRELWLTEYFIFLRPSVNHRDQLILAPACLAPTTTPHSKSLKSFPFLYPIWTSAGYLVQVLHTPNCWFGNLN